MRRARRPCGLRGAPRAYASGRWRSTRDVPTLAASPCRDARPGPRSAWCGTRSASTTRVPRSTQPPTRTSEEPDGGRLARWAERELPSATAEPAVQPARILIVEDEHLVAHDIQQRLERMGHAPDVVYSGRQALDRISTSHYDLVLMDIK